MRRAERKALNTDAILERLSGLHPKSIDLSLGRMQRLLTRLRHPERRLPPVVHVAGTNGKGSVIAFLAAILEAAGYGVHAYTSPHLISFSERIRIKGRVIAEGELAAALSQCERANGEAPITFFEITTAAALLAFAEHPADVLLLEVGLGGRLDATNVIQRPLLTAITPVAMDHMHFLGDSLAAIAGEKAGILKPGVPALIGPQPAQAARAIAARAAQLDAPLRLWGEAWRARAAPGGMFYRSRRRRLELPSPALAGRHQIDNAGLALACLDHMTGFEAGGEAIRRGLVTARWPGRLQHLMASPLETLLPPGAEIWLDGGHNAGAGEALAATLEEWGQAEGAAGHGPRPLYLVVAMLSAKRPVAFLEPLAPLARAVLGIAMPGRAAGFGAAEIAAAARAAGIAARPAGSLTEALVAIDGMAGAGAGAPPRVLICGSLYLAGKVLAGEDLGPLMPRSDTTRAPAA